MIINRFICLLVLASIYLIGENTYAQIPIGTWRTHLSFNQTVAVTANDDKIYTASSTGIFILDKLDGAVTKLTRLDGLSDALIATLGFNELTNTLIIGYEDGNIDLLRENQLINFDQLFISDRAGSKTINHINSAGPLAYLSTDFGVLILDLERLEVKESLFNLGPSGETMVVNASAIFNDSLFLAAELGVFAGNLNDNLKDFNLWFHFGLTEGVPAGQCQAIALTKNGLRCGIENLGLYGFEGGFWNNLNQLNNKSFISITHFDETAVVCQDSVYQLINNISLPITSQLARFAVDGIIIDGIVWIADEVNGLIKYSTGQEESIYPNGPSSNSIVHLKNIDDKIVAFPAAYNSTFEPLKGSKGFSIFENETWSNYNSTGNPKTILIPEFLDVTDVDKFPSQDEYIFSSFGYGLLRMNESGFEIINENSPSSPLENSNPPARNVFITSLSQQLSNIYMANYLASNPLHELNQDGVWQSFQTQLNYTQYTAQLLSTSWLDHWMLINRNFGGGIVVFNQLEGTTIYLISERGKGGLPSNTVNDMMLDLDEKLWVATNKGIVYYPYPRGILFEQTIDPVIPIYESNQLFRNEPVSAVAIDGGNRIWLGTDQGIWLFTDDGQTLEEHFNVDNSPLLSNNILDIAINHKSGEVFIATDKGVVSYRGTGTLGIETSTVKIYPNPVYPAFNGLITIEGVPDDSSITITDVSGRLIYKTRSNGNSATWNGLNASGRAVTTGVYLVFVSNDDKSKKQVGKIAIVK